MKKILQLRGMMCSCCEVRVANCLRNVPGVSDAGGGFSYESGLDHVYSGDK